MPCVSSIIDCFVDSSQIDEKDYSEETKKCLKEIKDSITVAVVSTAEKFIELNANPPKDTEVKTRDIDLAWKRNGDGFNDWRVDKVKSTYHNISQDFSTTILDEDDLFGQYTLMEGIKAAAIRNRFLFPLEDQDIMLEDDEQAKRIMNDLKLVMGKALPITYNSDFNMLTDESFSRIFFYGMGAVLLTRQERVSEHTELGPFEVDLKVLEGLSYRRKYRKLGSRIHFNKEQMVTAIHDYSAGKTYKPGDAGWNDAKTLAKVGALFLITAREHLCWTHLIVSNAATRESTIKLPPSHPIRRLLTVFSFHATEVNLSAFDVLVPKTCILQRASGITYSSLKAVFNHSYVSCNIFEPFTGRDYNPALQELIDKELFPFVTMGSEYYQIVFDFVKEWLANSGDASSDDQAKEFYNSMQAATKGQEYEIPAYTEENMINVLSSIIFTVTAYHELVGYLVDYALLPSRAGFRLTKKDPSAIDFQSYLLTSVIAASTSVKMPMLTNKFPNFFGVDGAPEWERTLWNSFQSKITEQSAKVQAANKKLPVEFNYFDPARFECSVSV